MHISYLAWVITFLGLAATISSLCGSVNEHNNPAPAPHCSLRPTSTLNVYVRNLAPSGTIPSGWDFTMFNPSYVDLTTFWNVQVRAYQLAYERGKIPTA